MCGIILSYLQNPNIVRQCFEKIRNRGPDNSKEIFIKNVYCGFHRLKINDLSSLGDQPMHLNGTYLLCNGEIYNFISLQNRFNFPLKTKSDCEIILHLYMNKKQLNLNIIELVSMLDGEFAGAIYDTNTNFIYLFRDCYGVRPLYWGVLDNKIQVVSSEQKSIDSMFEQVKILQYPPGYVTEMNLSLQGTFSCRKFHPNTNNTIISGLQQETILQNIRSSLINSVKKRLNGDRPLCSLISGGLDSSIVTAIAQKMLRIPLETFSIGMVGSTDLYWANHASKFIKTRHTNIELSQEDFLNAIPDTIKTIESYDVTTVRASVGNLLIAQWISKHSSCKIVLSGEFSDEVTAGYKYFKNAPDPNSLQKETLRLLDDIHYFDGLRADRCISGAGLECRLPFSDPEFVKYYLSIDPKLKLSHDKIEKWLLRKAFESENLLPPEILWRQKEAFSDAVSCPENSWHKIIQRHVNKIVTDEEFARNASKYHHNVPKTKEAYYYRKLFHEHYKCAETIPYQWLPKWCGNITDPSAREITN